MADGRNSKAWLPTIAHTEGYEPVWLQRLKPYYRFKNANNGKIHRVNTMMMARDPHGLGGGGVTNGVRHHGCRSKFRSIVANGCPYQRLRAGLATTCGNLL